MLIMVSSYFLIRSSVSSHAPFAGSFPTAKNKKNINHNINDENFFFFYLNTNKKLTEGINMIFGRVVFDM